MIAGGAGGGALLLAVVAFFLCRRRRAKRQSDDTAELPQFSNIKPPIAAPVFTPSPVFMTPAVRSPTKRLTRYSS